MSIKILVIAGVIIVLVGGVILMQQKAPAPAGVVPCPDPGGAKLVYSGYVHSQAATPKDVYGCWTATTANLIQGQRARYRYQLRMVDAGQGLPTNTSWANIFPVEDVHVDFSLGPNLTRVQVTDNDASPDKKARPTQITTLANGEVDVGLANSGGHEPGTTGNIIATIVNFKENSTTPVPVPQAQRTPHPFEISVN